MVVWRRSVLPSHSRAVAVRGLEPLPEAGPRKDIGIAAVRSFVQLAAIGYAIIHLCSGELRLSCCCWRGWSGRRLDLCQSGKGNARALRGGRR